MPKNIEGAATFNHAHAARARFFELKVMDIHHVEPQIDYITGQTLQKQYPALWASIDPTFVQFKSLLLPGDASHLYLREVSETVYHEGRLQVLINRFKKELLAPDCCDGVKSFCALAYHQLSIGNLAQALITLRPQPALHQRLTVMIEDGFPDAALQKLRQAQGFTVLQLGTVSGIATQHIEYLEEDALVGDKEPEKIAMKAQIMQHLFASSFK